MDLLKVKILDENTQDSRFYFLIIGQVYQRCYLLSRNFGKLVSQGTQSSRKKERAERIWLKRQWEKSHEGRNFSLFHMGRRRKKQMRIEFSANIMPVAVVYRLESLHVLCE